MQDENSKRFPDAVSMSIFMYKEGRKSENENEKQAQMACIVYGACHVDQHRIGNGIC